MRIVKNARMAPRVEFLKDALPDQFEAVYHVYAGRLELPHRLLLSKTTLTKPDEKR